MNIEVTPQELKHAANLVKLNKAISFDLIDDTIIEYIKSTNPNILEQKEHL